MELLITSQYRTHAAHRASCGEQPFSESPSEPCTLGSLLDFLSSRRSSASTAGLPSLAFVDDEIHLETHYESGDVRERTIIMCNPNDRAELIKELQAALS